MNIKRLTAIALTAVLLCGCTEIDYSDYSGTASGTTTSSATDNVSSVPPADITTEYMTEKYENTSASYSYSLEAEKLPDTELISDNKKYSGDGYITLGAYAEVKFDIEVPSAQFYNIAVSAFSKEGGSISLTVDANGQTNSENGVYKRPKGDLYGAYNIIQGDVFETVSLCPVYLKKGKHSITLQTVKNSVSLDKITVKNTVRINDSRYTDVSGLISGKDFDTDRVELMQYFKDIYGKKTLTAQSVTPNTNAEIEAIAEVTGRLPAIRASDLRYYTSAGATLSGVDNTDISLAKKWAESGGIVSYTWYWYAPVGKATFYIDECDFDIDSAISDKEDLAVLNSESLSIMLSEEKISEECYALLSDMDAVARQLAVLKDSGVTVLFRPLPTDSSGWYWWEKDSETYKWLWQTMFRRFDELHGLSNLIWVYTADIDPVMYPGDDYVDIVGCDVYDNTDTAHAGAMLATDSLTLNKKMLALTECAKAPDPDIMARDNVMWLWTAPWNGRYLINEKGELTGDYISVNELRKLYNHELTITKDEIEY